LKYDRGVVDFFVNMRKGTLIAPDYHKQRNQPSLWTYYELLP